MSVTFNPKDKVNKEVQHLLDMESTIESCLDDLLNNNYLSKEDYKFLKPYYSKPGLMYRLCKVHKFNPITGDAPFRPILSSVGTSTYNLLQKLLYQFLKTTPLTSLLYLIHFHFVLKYDKIRLYTLYLLTFIHILPTSLLMKRQM